MINLNRQYSEKRDFIRMFIDAKVTIKDLDTGESFSGESRNLSGGGALFVTEHAFKEGDKLEVSIHSQQSKLPPLVADMEVIRVEKEGDGYAIAGSILKVK